MALVAAAFVFSGSCGRGMSGGGGPNPSGQDGPVVATVGDVPVTENAIWAMAQQSLVSLSQQYQQTLPPSMEPQFVAGATEQQVKGALLMELAKRKGVVLDEAAIMQAMGVEADRSIEMQKQQLIMGGKLKADASPALVEAAMKEAYGGKTPEEAKKTYLENFQKSLSDPAKMAEAAMHTANTLVMDKLKSEVPATDEIVKASYNLYNCKRVFLKTDKHVGEDLVKKAEGIIAEIKGGLKFDAAMDKYSDDLPDKDAKGKDKPKHENKLILDEKTMTLNESYSPVLKLKPGEVGGPYTFGDGGVSIVTFIDKGTQLPPDYEKEKAKYAKDYQESMGAKTLQDELDKLAASNIVDWKSPAYHVLYDIVVWEQAPTTQKLSPADKTSQLEAFVKRAEEAKTDPMGSRAAPIARFRAFSQIWSGSTDAEKAKLTDTRIGVLQDFLQISESSDYRLELADLLAVKKDAAGVTENLKMAAASIGSDFGPSGQKVFSDVQAKLGKFQAANLINAEQVKVVRDDLDAWRKNKAEKDKFDKEQKASEEKMRKEAEAAQKAEEAKQKANAPKTAPGKTPSPGPTKPPGK